MRLGSCAGAVTLALALGAVHCSEADDDDRPGPGPDAAVDAAAPDAGEGRDAGQDSAADAGPYFDPLGPTLVSASDASEQESEPSIAVTDTGRVAVVWMGFVGREPAHVGVVVSDDGGESFTPIQTIEPPDDRLAADPVVVATPDGAVWLIFEGFFPARPGELPEDTLIYAARLDPDEDAFGAPVLVSSEDRVFNDKPWIALTGRGTLLASWVFEHDGFITALVARSEDGASWDVSVLDDRPLFHELYAPCAPEGSDRAYIAYFGQFGIGLRISEDDGRTWPAGDDTLVSRPVDGVVGFDDPRCVARDDDVWVSYGPAESQWTAQTPALLRSVVVAHSLDGGATFAEYAEVLGGDNLFMHPQLALEDGGGLDIVTYRGARADDPDASLLWTRSVDDGATWSAPRTVGSSLLLWATNGQAPWLGDYEGLTARSRALWGAFVDNQNHDGHVAFYRMPTP